MLGIGRVRKLLGGGVGDSDDRSALHPLRSEGQTHPLHSGSVSSPRHPLQLLFSSTSDQDLLTCCVHCGNGCQGADALIAFHYWLTDGQSVLAAPQLGVWVSFEACQVW